MPRVLTRTWFSPVSVDLGACSLRAVQLRRERNRWTVHHWVNLEREPQGPEPPGGDYRTEMSLAFGRGTFSGSRTRLLLSPPGVEFKQLEVPPAVLDRPPDELRHSLQYELDRQMPWPAAESEVAAWPIRPGASGRSHAMVVVARSSHVQERLDLLEHQRLECLAADIVPHGMIHLGLPLDAAAGMVPDSESGDAGASPSRPHEESATAPVWGVVDLGFLSARLYLIQGDRTVYARVLRGGGRDLTRTLADTLRVEFTIAEHYKRLYGIRKTDRGVRSVVGGLSRISEKALPGVLYAILRDTLDGLVEDIERSCRFALGQFAGATAGPLLLVGGGARLRGLDKVLSDRLGIPVLPPRPAGPLAHLAANGQHAGHAIGGLQHYPALAPCIGLAMQEEQA